MKARRPPFDFSATAPLWTPSCPAFAQSQNAGGLLMPYLEPYLIKVLKAAREQLDPREHAQLISDINAFNQQEANHYQVHARQNVELRRHYTGLEPFEKRIERDFAAFLAKRSLRFNLAYCEAFESIGPIAAAFMFEHADEILAGSDAPGRELWLWHLAEEYEHRSVCFEVYHALGGGWLRRVTTLFYFLLHFVRHTQQLRRHMAAQDRAAGRGADDAAARERQRRLMRAQERFSLSRLLRVLAPGYSPGRIAPLPAAERYLAALDRASHPAPT